MGLDKEKLRIRLNEIKDENMKNSKNSRNVIESLSARAIADTITDIIIEINSGDFD